MSITLFNMWIDTFSGTFSNHVVRSCFNILAGKVPIFLDGPSPEMAQRPGGGDPRFLLARAKVKLKVLLSPSPQCSLCKDPPPPPPLLSGQSETGPLLRFFLRGEGFVHRLPQCSVVRLTVSRQTGLKFNHRPSRKVIFYLQPSEMQSNINRQNVSMYLKSHYFSWSSQTFGSWIKNLWTGKTTSRVLKNALSEHYNTLQLSYISKFYMCRGGSKGGGLGG